MTNDTYSPQFYLLWHELAFSPGDGLTVLVASPDLSKKQKQNLTQYFFGRVFFTANSAFEAMV